MFYLGFLLKMNDWTRPVSEYKGEFNWNFNEGFSREGRREKEIERLSADLKQLRLVKKRGEEQKKSNSKVRQARLPDVIIDMYGDEFEVCETAKEALERLLKSDHRLASKYHNYVKKLDARLKPYGTSYDNSFMKSANVFPSVRAYEMAAEEFEKNQDVFGLTQQKAKAEDLSPSEWESKLANYGNGQVSSFEEAQENSSQLKLEQQLDDLGQRNNNELEDPDIMRQNWVDHAHRELSKTYEMNHRSNEEARGRSKDIVPLWLRRGLQRKGLI